MTYNIHPIIVHFPIAFLFFYSLIKLLPLKRFIPRVSWDSMANFLLVVGVPMAMLAQSTGEAAEHLLNPNHSLVEMHAFFAGATVWIYGAILVAKILLHFNDRMFRFVSFIAEGWFSILLAFLGLVALFTTGLLGGVLTHGAYADPLAPTVLKLLGL